MEQELPGAWVLEVFRRGGVDLDILTRQLPGDVELMLREMDTILPDNINRLLQACADISGKPDFGLNMNELVELSMYGLFGYVLLNCGTVRDLFDALVRYHTVHHDGGITYEMTTRKNMVNIRICHDERARFCHRHTTEWGLGFIPDFLKHPLGDLAIPLTAQFMHGAPDDLHRLHACFGENLEFDQACDQLVYPRFILNKRIAETDSKLLETLRELADRHLMELEGDYSLHKTIRAILFEKLSTGKNNASDVAAALNMSTSTFKRNLIKEGIDFRNTKETIKNDLAKQLLSQPTIKMYEIAQKMGFKNQSSFTRFFIRLNQLTPLQFRKSKKTKKVNN